MKLVYYHGYTITAFAVSRGPGSWFAQVQISSKDQPEITLDDPTEFATESEAEEHAVGIGKHWVNNRMQTQL